MRRQRRSMRGYSLWRGGRKLYIGITNDLHRRASEHRAAGRRGRMRVDTYARTPQSVRRWERHSLKSYRRTHGGKLPRWNKT